MAFHFILKLISRSIVHAECPSLYILFFSLSSLVFWNVVAVGVRGNWSPLELDELWILPLLCVFQQETVIFTYFWDFWLYKIAALSLIFSSEELLYLYNYLNLCRRTQKYSHLSYGEKRNKNNVKTPMYILTNLSTKLVARYFIDHSLWGWRMWQLPLNHGDLERMKNTRLLRWMWLSPLLRLCCFCSIKLN